MKEKNSANTKTPPCQKTQTKQNQNQTIYKQTQTNTPPKQTNETQNQNQPQLFKLYFSLYSAPSILVFVFSRLDDACSCCNWIQQWGFLNKENTLLFLKLYWLDSTLSSSEDLLIKLVAIGFYNHLNRKGLICWERTKQIESLIPVPLRTWTPSVLQTLCCRQFTLEGNKLFRLIFE